MTYRLSVVPAASIWILRTSQHGITTLVCTGPKAGAGRGCIRTPERMDIVISPSSSYHGICGPLKTNRRLATKIFTGMGMLDGKSVSFMHACDICCAMRELAVAVGNSCTKYHVDRLPVPKGKLSRKRSYPSHKATVLGRDKIPHNDSVRFLLVLSMVGVVFCLLCLMVAQHTKWPVWRPHLD